MAGLRWIDEVARKRGIRAVRTTRDASPFTYSLYLSAAATSHFLRTAKGEELLRQADVRSGALMAAAIAKHQASYAGAVLGYAWCLIRKLHPTGPGPLHYWGSPQNRPPPDSDPALQAFCTFLGTAAEEQKAFYATMQRQHSALGFEWADLLQDARGRVHAEMEMATVAVDVPDLSHATVTLQGNLGVDATGQQSLATTQDDQPSAVVDVCRYGLNMSKAELLGTGCANLEDRIRNSLDACKLECAETKTHYPLRYEDKVYEVRCMATCSGVGRAALYMFGVSIPEAVIAQHASW